jgi:hypothetical protein
MAECNQADRILQSAMVHVPGSTEQVVTLELFNVIDEFLRRSSAWRYETDVILQEGMSDYGMALPADATTVRALGVMHRGAPVATTSQTAAVVSSLGVLNYEQSFSDGDARYAPDKSDLSSNLFTYAIYRPNYITITGTPDAAAMAEPMKVLVALSIAPGCLECACGDWQLPEWMFEQFFQDWYEGTLGRLYAMPSKPWSSEKLAIYHGKRFRQAMGYRKQEANRGFVYGVPGWKYPRVGGWT